MVYIRSCPQKAGFAPLGESIFSLCHCHKKTGFAEGLRNWQPFSILMKVFGRITQTFGSNTFGKRGCPHGYEGRIFEIPTLQSYKISQGRESLLQLSTGSSLNLNQQKRYTFWDNGSVPLRLKFLFKTFPFKIMVTPESPQRLFFDTLKWK